MSYKIITTDELHGYTAEVGEVKLFRSGTERFWVNQATKDHSETMASEMHDHEADIYIVQEGDADIYLGGTLVEPFSPRAGQHRGTGLDGATRHHIAKGDVVIIPEGIPHMLDSRNTRIVFLIIKEDVGEK